MKDGLYIDREGNKFWYKNYHLHRLDGPAILWQDGIEWWYKEGSPHREDGPAREWGNGNKLWYYEGEFIKCSSTKEFLQIIKLRAFW